MANDPMRTAADDIVSYCTDEANRHHGYDAIATAVDHDLANAYSRIAGEVERCVASPAAPADDEATVKRMRQAIHDELCACEGGVSPCPHSSVELNAAARAALAALREGQQQ